MINTSSICCSWWEGKAISDLKSDFWWAWVCNIQTKQLARHYIGEVVLAVFDNFKHDLYTIISPCKQYEGIIMVVSNAYYSELWESELICNN